jgi:hypothetical protein
MVDAFTDLSVPSFFVSGDLDVDGTANLDVVDIDGAVDFASTTAHAGNATFADNAKAIFGAGSDLEILSNGTDGLIRNGNSTGEIRMESDDRIIISDIGFNEVFAVFNDDDDVKLYHNGNQKLATTSSGINVTGDVDASENYKVNGTLLIDSSMNLQNLNLVQVATGSSTAPSIRFTGDTNTGFARPAADTLGFITGGSERMRIDSSGNVGIGTTSASGALHVSRSGLEAGITLERTSSATAKFTIAANDGNLTFTDAANSAERMRIDSSGNLGLGMTPTTNNISKSISLVNGGSIFGYGSGTYITGNSNYNGAFNAVATGADSRILLDGNVIFSRSASATAGSAGTVSESMRIDTAGKVAMGTSSADADASVLSIKGTDPAQIYDGQIIIHGSATSGAADTGAGIGFKGHHGTGNRNLGAIQCLKENATSGNIDTYMRFVIRSNSGGLAEAMRIDSSGNVGIGTASPGRILTVSDTSSSPFISIIGSASNEGGILFGDNVSDAAGQIRYNHPSGYLYFSTEGAEALRIDSSGQLLISCTGQTSDAPNADGFLFQGIGNLKIRVNSDGQVCQQYYSPTGGTGSPVGTITVNSSSTAFNTSSDQRLKENIADADDSGSKVDAIQVRKFDWIADGSHQDYGMVAQELQAVAPEAVSAPEDPNEMMGVDYSKLVPMLVKEIQSLRARVQQLENN